MVSRFSSYTGMAADRYNVYASDAEGFVWALNADNGSARWSQKALRNRQLSDVAVLGSVVAVGDFEGYVHFLSVEDGSLIGRTRVGSRPIRGGMLAADGKLFVQGDGGDLDVLSLHGNPNLQTPSIDSLRSFVTRNERSEFHSTTW